MPGSAAIGNLAVNLSLETAAFTDGATKAQASMRALSTSAQGMSGGFKSFSMSASNARVVGLELTHITRSLGEQLAMGVSPARAFASEIGRISTAVQYAGGVGALGKAIASLVAPFATVAAGAGLLATAFLGVKQAADSTDMQAYIATLGLTDAQIKRLKDTTVTWGDVTKATFQVLAEKAGTSSGAISGAFSGAFRSVGDFGKFSVAIILAAFGAMVKGVADLCEHLPALVGGAFDAAVNLGIAAIEKLLNVTVAGLNQAGGFINKVFGSNIGTITGVHLPRLQTSVVGTMKAIGADVSGTFHSIFNSTESVFNQISARAVQLRKNDLAAEAAAMKSSDAADKAAKGHEARAKAMKKEADAADGLTKDLDKLLSKEAGVDSDMLHPKPLAKIELPDVQKDIIEKIKTPWEQWVDSVPQSAAEVTSAFQSIEVKGLDGIGSAIADVITGARSLKDAFGEVARSIISDLIEMAAKMLIFRALSGLFPSVDINSLNDTIASNNTALGVSMPHVIKMASGGSGAFGGFGGVDQNVLSLNGSPIARVSRGENFSVTPANSNATRAVTVNQYNNFAGGAVTRDDLLRMHSVTVAAAEKAVGEKNRRAG